MEGELNLLETVLALTFALRAVKTGPFDPIRRQFCLANMRFRAATLDKRIAGIFRQVDGAGLSSKGR